MLWGFSASEMWHSKVHSVKTTIDTVSTSWASCHIIIPFISPPPHSRSIYFNSGCCEVNQYTHAFLRNFYPTFIKCYSVAKKSFCQQVERWKHFSAFVATIPPGILQFPFSCLYVSFFKNGCMFKCSLCLNFCWCNLHCSLFCTFLHQLIFSLFQKQGIYIFSR